MPLLISQQIEFAAKFHPTVEVVTRTVQDPIAVSNWGQVEARARKLANALQGLGVKPGDCVAARAEFVDACAKPSGWGRRVGVGCGRVTWPLAPGGGVPIWPGPPDPAIPSGTWGPFLRATARALPSLTCRAASLPTHPHHRQDLQRQYGLGSTWRGAQRGRVADRLFRGRPCVRGGGRPSTAARPCPRYQIRGFGTGHCGGHTGVRAIGRPARCRPRTGERGRSLRAGLHNPSPGRARCPKTAAHAHPP